MRIALCLVIAVTLRAADGNPSIEELKAAELSAGFHPAGNFAHADAAVAYYRCYFTGKVELPDSYDQLGLREGTKDGCQLDASKYDVFFYAIEAVASGHDPITPALKAATPERRATVVPHEDFHAQVERLPTAIAEAAATLEGFLTAAEALHEPPSEAGLFLQKAEMVNRYYERLRVVYRSGHNRSAALAEKERLFAALARECASIRPEPRSFNKCVSAPNNAGLAFDRTYTQYYPLLYRVYLACAEDLRCTTEAILKAPQKRPAAEVVRYLEAAAGARH